ncbi:MAG: rRNA maturation RNase YbeY [Bacteroidales bacterium]|jgi:rRNA maturation RNase YbeY|nr:rRNA maturation RNase YbeY [Bacteroidales bacterium]
MAITVLSNTDFKLPIPRKALKTWIVEVAARYGRKVGEITYLFCDDEYLLQVNNQYLNHDFYTDVITFDYTESETIYGDIIISIDRIKDNAQSLNVPFEQELRRVIIHGILHLCGLKDKTEQEAKAMRQAEEEALAQIRF